MNMTKIEQNVKNWTVLSVENVKNDKNWTVLSVVNVGIFVGQKKTINFAKIIR
jgi:hypothetical protein